MIFDGTMFLLTFLIEYHGQIEYNGQILFYSMLIIIDKSWVLVRQKADMDSTLDTETVENFSMLKTSLATASSTISSFPSILSSAECHDSSSSAAVPHAD